MQIDGTTLFLCDPRLLRIGISIEVLPRRVDGRGALSWIVLHIYL